MRNRRPGRDPQRGSPRALLGRGNGGLTAQRHVGPHPQRARDLLDGEPTGILKLGVVPEIDDGVGVRAGGAGAGAGAGAYLADGADHEAGGEGPRLRAVDGNACHGDTGLFPYLAPHGVLDRLGRLDEAGEGGVEARGPAGLAAEQHAVAVGAQDGSDDGWVSAREAEVGHGGAGGALGLLVAGVRGIGRGTDALAAGVD